MKKLILKFIDFILYFNATDERIRRGYEKSGYIMYTLIIFAGLADFIIRAVIQKKPFTDIWFTFFVLFGSALYMSLFTIRNGLTFLDTKRQKRALFITVFTVPIISVIFMLFSVIVSKGVDFVLAHTLIFISAALLTYFLTGLLLYIAYILLNYFAKKQGDKDQ